MNIILDDDKDEYQPHFDPDMNIIFGKNGLDR